MAELIGNHRPETIVVHGSVLNRRRFGLGSDVDVVGTAPEMTVETRTRLLEFMGQRGIDPRRVEVDYKQTPVDYADEPRAVRVPSPLGIDVPFRRIAGHLPVELDAFGGLAAALRASGLGHDNRASEELDQVWTNGVPIVTDVAPQYGALEYPRHLGRLEYRPTSEKALAMTNDAVVGVKGMQRAFEKASGRFTGEFLRRMKFGGTILRVAQGRIVVPREAGWRVPDDSWIEDDIARVVNFTGFDGGIDVHAVGMSQRGGMYTLGEYNLTRHFDDPAEFEQLFAVR